VKTHEVREAFLRFFEERGHRRVTGAPIVPPGDPTLLFTSAGMVQFKPYFTGQAEPPSPRMVSVQKCFRTSDIESVGDASHLTFFEMLGNFSVGDYFKAEAIPWAYEFLTQVLKLPSERLWPAIFEDDEEAFDLWRKQGFSAERIMRYGEEHNYWFSGDVGPCGPDSEIHYDFGEQFGCGSDCHPAHGHPRFVEIWNLVFMTYYCDGEKREPLPKKNIDTGSGFERVMSVLLHNSPGWDKNRLPSVYDTEVFAPMIGRIEQLSGKKYGADEATDRAIRIVAEHARAVTFLIGDERTPVVPSNEERGYVCRRMLRRAVYFGRRHLAIEQPFMADLANTVVEMMKESYPELERQRQFVADIIAPEEHRFDQTLGRGSEIWEELLIPFAKIVGEWRSKIDAGVQTKEPEDWFVAVIEANYRAYSEIVEFTVARGETSSGLRLPPRAASPRVGRPLLDRRKQAWEEARTVIWEATDVRRILSDLGAPNLADRRILKRVRATIEPHRDLILDLVAQTETACRTISGDEAFLLHDTYGFPIDLTRDIAEQNGFTVDIAGFEAEMSKQRDRARASAGGAESVAADTLYASLVAEPTVFTGYLETETTSRVVAIVVAGVKAQDAKAGQDVEAFLAATPLYPEGGGQVGDRGEIVGPNGRVEVLDTQRVAGKLIVHRGRVTEGRIAVGDEVTARVDPQHRGHTKRNHTATHLLHAALRQVIGPHVRQAGSLVAPDHLRFDFTHTEAVTPEQLAAVESLVNEKVREDIPVHTRETSFDEAIGEGVLAFFGEKYGDSVRVVEVNSSVPRFSAELCGGTHCERTGEIGAIVITGESSIGSGMRRIEALTGAGAERHIREQEQMLADVAQLVGAPRGTLKQKVAAMAEENAALKRKNEKLERSLASGAKNEDLAAKAQNVDGVCVLASRVDAPSVDALRFIGDSVRKSIPSGAAVLGSVIDDKPMFIALVTKDIVERGVHAGNLLKRVAAVAGGSAGGRPDMAQGGGKDVAKLDEALAVVPDAVREMLGG
jgi:alanyl-tRNA synthetase